MKITIEMDSVHELENLMAKRKIRYHDDVVKKDPILARELYEAYHRACNKGKQVHFPRDNVLVEDPDSVLINNYSDLLDEHRQPWQHMANLLEEMKK